MANEFLDKNGLKHLWDKVTSTFAKKEDLNDIGGGNSTLAIPCVLDLATMSATGIQIGAQTVIDAFNANKHIFLKVDASQMGGGTTSYTVASLTQFVIVPGGDAPLLGFDFIMMISGVPNLINAEWWAGSYSAAVTITPLATQSQIGGLTFTTSSIAPTVDNSNVITFVDEG